MFSLKADHVLLRVHVIVFKSEVNEEKWSQNFFLDKHHFVVLQRSSSQMTTHASKSKREEDKLPNRFSVNFYDFEKKRTLLLFTLFRRRKCHLAFLHGGTTMKWWRHEEGIYWPLNQLPIITCKSYFYPFHACPLVGILAAANERNERICTIFEDLSCCQ